MLRRLKRWIQRRRCQHSHTFRWSLPLGTHWYSDGKRMGIHHGGLQIIGCYICGKVWCCDYRA